MLKHVKYLFILFVCTVYLILGFFSNETVYSKDADYNSEEFINVTVYEKINPAIVLVEAQMADGLSSGTGCVINKSGIILTSSHVVNNSTYIEVTTSKGETYKAEVVKAEDSNGDLALLKIKPKNPLPTIKLGDSSLIKVGQKVLAIGNPFGFNGTLTTGIVSRIDYERNKIQTDAAINPGSSGGPILNAKGEVIGISQSIFNPDNNKSNIGIGFAVPANEVKKLISAYMK
ncbi:MAG: S1C family serine protease [Candidatus Avigastranaerophilus sp.]